MKRAISDYCYAYDEKANDILEIRKRLGYSQQVFASILGISVERLSALENGKERPTIFEFEKIMWITNPYLS